MDRTARTPSLREVERWFVRRGLPHAIDDYSARRDVLTRTVPLLTLVFLAEVVGTAFGERFRGWQQAGVLLLAVLAVGGAVALVNRARRRPWFERPARIGGGELAVFVLVPGALAGAVDRSLSEAAVLAGVNTVLLALSYGFAYLGILPMVGFGLRQILRRMSTLSQLLARVLPLLLLFVTFVFLNAEMWQVANDFTAPAYAVVIGFLVAVTFAFVAVRLPVELGELATFESWDDVRRVAAQTDAPGIRALGGLAAQTDAEPVTTLDRRDRRNVSVLLFVSYAVHVLAIGVIVAVSLVVLGVAAIRERTILQWTVQEGERVAALARLRIGGAEHLLTVVHLRVAGFIAVFAMLQFAVQLMLDQSYREEFAADVAGDLREVLAVQALYQQAIAGADDDR